MGKDGFAPQPVRMRGRRVKSPTTTEIKTGQYRQYTCNILRGVHVTIVAVENQ